MCAKSSERIPPSRPRGFTMVELILVMVMLGVMAIVLLPLMNAAA